MNKYELALAETQSVLDEWLISETRERRGPQWHRDIANAIVQRLIAKGVIQSTDPEDLVKVY